MLKRLSRLFKKSKADVEFRIHNVRAIGTKGEILTPTYNTNFFDEFEKNFEKEFRISLKSGGVDKFNAKTFKNIEIYEKLRIQKARVETQRAEHLRYIGEQRTWADADETEFSNNIAERKKELVNVKKSIEHFEKLYQEQMHANGKEFK